MAKITYTNINGYLIPKAMLLHMMQNKNIVKEQNIFMIHCQKQLWQLEVHF